MADIKKPIFVGGGNGSPVATQDEVEHGKELAQRYRCEFVDLKNFHIQHELFRKIPVLGFSFYGLGRVKRDLSEARRAVESQKSKIDAALADVDFQMRRAREEHLRIRLLSVARISDYRRELEFWSDTVRRVLYARSESRADREGFLRGVTDALKTHLTNRSSDRRDFDEVVIMAEVIAGGVARRARTREVGDEPARDDLARDEVPREVPVPPPTRDSTLGD